MTQLGQFHQHSTRAFFVQKFAQSQTLSSKDFRTKNARVKC